MVTWTSPQLSSHMSGLVHWVHVWLHSCLPCHNHGVSVYNANKTLLKLFPLWRGWEKQQHVRDVMIPRCDGNGDDVAEPPRASWCPFLWNIGCYTLRKAKEMCLGMDREKELWFVPQHLYLQILSWEPQSIANCNRNSVHNNITFPSESTSILYWHLSFDVFVYPWCRNEALRSAAAGEET